MTCAGCEARPCGTAAGPGSDSSRCCCVADSDRDSTAWTSKHRQWLRSLRLEETALAATFAQMVAMIEERELRVEAIEADLSLYQQQGLFADQVRQLSAYRGIDLLGGLTLACDWRRFPTASRFWALSAWSFRRPRGHSGTTQAGVHCRGTLRARLGVAAPDPGERLLDVTTQSAFRGGVQSGGRMACAHRSTVPLLLACAS